MAIIHLVLGLIIILILIAILAPFFTRTSQRHTVEETADFQQKELVFIQLSDLEYDYQMKKISQHDYEQIRAELTARAAKWIEPDEQNQRAEQQVDDENKRYLEDLKGREAPCVEK
jgi:cytochrome c-type biogenesis protein CcmI